MQFMFTQLNLYRLAALLIVMSCTSLSASINLAALPSSGIAPETSAKILRISEVIDNQALTLDSEYNAAPLDLTQQVTMNDLARLRVWIASSIDNADPEFIQRAIKHYSSAAAKINSADDVKIATIFQLYTQVKNLEMKSTEAKVALDALQQYQIRSETWFVRHRAYLLDSTLLMHNQNFSASLDRANLALNVIPNQDSAKALEASFEANGIISVIYLYLAELDFAAESVTNYIQQGIKLDRPIDGLSLLNSLTFGLERWGEYETALTIAETSFRLSKNASADKSVKAHYRYAQILNQTGQYTLAEGIAEDGLSLAFDGIWKLNLQAQLVISLSGQGKVDAAKSSMKAFEQSLNENPKFNGRFQSKIRNADALIAIAENRPKDVYSLLNENLIENTRRLLRNSSDETRTLMGTLANNKEIQRTREAKLQLQNTLKQERIEAQARQNFFQSIIIVLLIVLVVGAAIFALKERRNAVKARFLRDRAFAGEKAKSDFLAVMSHELRTPLNGIIGLAEILSRTGPTPDVKFKSGVIYKSGLSLLDLLVNILDMSKMETGKIDIVKKPVSVRDIISSLGELWDPKASQKNITFTRHVADDVPEILIVDGLRLRQCLENLISNAIKFTKDGRVHLHVTYAPHKRLKHQTLKIIVADTGVGMSAQKASEVFNPFTQADTTLSREFGGSGLGLAITRSLSRLMGGETLLNTALGKGSEFTVTLQASPAKGDLSQNITSTLPPSVKHDLLIAEQKFGDSPRRSIPTLPSAIKLPPVIKLRRELEVPESRSNLLSKPPKSMPLKTPSTARSLEDARISQTQPNNTLQGLRVLIAEDIPTNRDVLKIFLSPAGCKVSMANDGKQALDALDSEVFDLVFMDIRMPEMDGIEAIQILRAGGGPNSNIGIIALTADTSAATNAQCIAAGADVFLTKPVVSKELFSAIQFALREAKNRSINAAQIRTSKVS